MDAATPSATARSAAIEAGVAAGLAGLAVFLVLHHVWIVPIWFVAPLGAMIAALGGAAVGAAYAEIVDRLPRCPLTAVVLVVVIGAILAPSVIVAQLAGPVYAFRPGGGGGGAPLVPVAMAIGLFAFGLFASTALSGAIAGALLGRTRRAATATAVAGVALALGPGHNIPLLGASPATSKELAILSIVIVIASVVLVGGHAWLRRRPPGAGDAMASI